jgi:hypothetical protein
MSLTVAKWEQLFEAAKRIEKQANGLITQTKKLAILRETKIIKDLVQEVIGQLE